jgi:hypothetical protein
MTSIVEICAETRQPMTTLEMCEALLKLHEELDRTIIERDRLKAATADGTVAQRRVGSTAEDFIRLIEQVADETVYDLAKALMLSTDTVSRTTGGHDGNAPSLLEKLEAFPKERIDFARLP